MCDFSEIEASAVSDSNIPWDPMNSDSDVRAIEEKMQGLNTGENPSIHRKEVTINDEKEEAMDAEETEKKEPEIEEPDFGEAEKVVPTDAEVPAEPRDNVTVPLKPRPDLLQPSLGGNTSDGDTVRPAAKTRVRSIPPVSRSKSNNRSKSASRARSRTRDADKTRGRSPPRPGAQKGPQDNDLWRIHRSF